MHRAAAWIHEAVVHMPRMKQTTRVVTAGVASDDVGQEAHERSRSRASASRRRALASQAQTAALGRRVGGLPERWGWPHGSQRVRATSGGRVTVLSDGDAVEDRHLVVSAARYVAAAAHREAVPRFEVQDGRATLRRRARRARRARRHREQLA